MAKEKFLWTDHVHQKMQYYKLSPQIIKRVIRYPDRSEVGVIENGVAVMRVSSSKKYSEIWTMYVIPNSYQIRIITAWRYPARSSSRDPVPAEILQEIKTIL